MTTEDIEQFEENYRGSEDEKKDLLSFLEEKRGDVSSVLAYIIGSRNEDIERIVKIYEVAFKEKRLSSKFRRTFSRTRQKIVTLEELDQIEEDIEAASTISGERDENAGN